MEKEIVKQELQFKAVRSSGAGGQHVNKVSTKIELSFAIENSKGLSDLEKERLLKKLASRLTKENVLLLQCDESRSQHKNKEIAIERCLDILSGSLKVPKKRKKTKPSRSAVEKRLRNKKKVADKKATRGKPNIE